MTPTESVLGPTVCKHDWNSALTDLKHFKLNIF
jgi:hypothetical protein